VLVGYAIEIDVGAETAANLHSQGICGIEAAVIIYAPAFYQKHGFELAWQLDDFPPGHQHCSLIKRLS
jgi:hypothetical protein